MYGQNYLRSGPAGMAGRVVPMLSSGENPGPGRRWRNGDVKRLRAFRLLSFF